MSEYVDRDELRRKLEEAVGSPGLALDGSWGQGWLTGVRDVLYCIDNMPPLEVPRGWSRDELLAAIDAGSTVERLGGFGNWYTPPRSFIWAWPDDVVAYDVRVVAPVPKTEDVPLHEAVGRKLPGHDGEIEIYGCNADGFFVCTSTRGLVPVTLNADHTVTVQAEGEA